MHLTRPRREAVPEPSVDRLLARPQGRDRFAALVDVAQLRIHHRAQRTAPPMCRIYTDNGDAAARKHTTGYRELEREGTGAADDLTVRECRVHALDRQHLRESLDPRLVGHHAEVLADAVERASELGEIGDRTDLEHSEHLGAEWGQGGAEQGLRTRNRTSGALV